MIGLDTNVVVRYLVRDDPRQTALADALFDQLTPQRPGFVSMVAAVEIWWVLRTRYRIPVEECRAVVSALLASQELVVERDDLVRQALATASTGADFADALLALLGRAAGCTEVVTFDRTAARTTGMRLLG